MERDNCDILEQTTAIANRSAMPAEGRFRQILEELAAALELQRALFLLCNPYTPLHPQLIAAPGPQTFLPLTAVLSPTESLQEAGLLSPLRPSTYCAVVRAEGRSYGLLFLQSPPGTPFPPFRAALARALAASLVPLVRDLLTERSRTRHASRIKLLTRLGRILTEAPTRKALLKTTVQALRQHSGAACVLLRPLIAETVLGRSYLRCASPFRQWRPLFADLEQSYSSRVLESGRSLFQYPLSGFQDEGLPAVGAVAVPLVFKERILGTLTLFGDEDSLLTLFDRDSGTLFAEIGTQIAQALEQVSTLETLEALGAENERKLRESVLLYRISRALHSTLRLDELGHLILSAVVSGGGGEFERAMLFMVNERSAMLQGILGVTRRTASLVLPPGAGIRAWEQPALDAQTLTAQSRDRFCRRVKKQRLPLEATDNPLAGAVREGRPVPVKKKPPGAAGDLAAAFDLEVHACVPLQGRERPLAVLVVERSGTRPVDSDQLRFLELFGSLAGAALENSMLLQRLESAHQDLRETQERLIQGEKMAVLGELAASVTHELKNPLVSIGGFAQRLSRLAEGPEKVRRYSSIIFREVQRMEKMLGNILDFSKQQMLCFDVCRLTAIVKEALVIEEDALRRSRIRVVKDLADDLPPFEGDEQKLRQVVINLVANARQVMAEGGTLTIRTYATALRGDRAVALEVEDTGGGVPPEVLRNIFNPFFTTKDEGTGLGLSISHRIVEQHQGEIEVQNREGGAVFIMRLPERSGPYLTVDKIKRFG